MKLTQTISIGLLAFGLSAALGAEDIKINVPSGSQASAQAAAPAAAPAFSEAQVLEALGWMAAKSTRLDLFKLNPSQQESVLKGMAFAISGKDVPYDEAKIGPFVQEFAQRKNMEFFAELKQEQLKASAAYFAKLKDNKSVVQLPSGLCYEIVQPGMGAYPIATDTVKVHYTGKLLDGTVFDSSVQRGKPLDISLGRVIKGWTEGIQKINKGGKIRLHIPAELAYGDGDERIPPGATLIFDVELIEILPAAPAVVAPAPAAPAPAK